MTQGKIYSNIFETIGNTPIVMLNKISKGKYAKVALKLECFNPLSSVKDRMALAMLDAAEKSGKLKPGMQILEPTSGNTGIGLAFVAAVKGYPITVVMPETMSIERRMMLRLLGADLILTPAANGMPGAIKKATQLLAENKNYFMPQQFENPANPQIHYETTAEEIWRDTAGKIDIFVVGVGTGGTLTGAGKRLKEYNPNLKIVAVEPVESAVLSGNKPGPHKIQGIGAGFIPEVLDVKLIDEIIQVNSTDSMQTSLNIIKMEGLPIGISSGAVALACLQLADRKENKDKLIVGIAASGLERYLSTAMTEAVRLEVSSLPVSSL